MYYKNINAHKIKEYKVSAFDGGFVDGFTQDVIEDSELSYCENMYFSNGLLTSRMGLSPIGEYYGAPANEVKTTPLRATETAYYIDGKCYRLAYMISGDSTSYEYVNIYLLNGNEGVRKIGRIGFNRVTASEFYRAANIYFIVGNPTGGAGIYAFITRQSGNDKKYEVYEANSSLNEWENISHSFYVPVIYANGRGTRYSEATTFKPLDYPTPIEPEERNILTGAFKAYYTSDGLSHIFNLPISNLDNEAVVCRVYTDSENYTQWTIPASSSVTTATFMGETIKCLCDRKSGSVWFGKENIAYSIPVMEYCSTNNIMIKAYKTVTNGKERILSSKRCAIYNSRVYLCDNDIHPHEVYSALLTNPLYFPKNAKAIVGESTSAVTALGVQNGKLIAFKSGEIYRINVTEGAQSVYNALILGENDEFGRADTLSAQTVHTTVGCDCPDTVRLCGNRLVWMNSHGGVYTLATTTYGNENNVYEISMPIISTLCALDKNDAKNSFAIDDHGHYILVCGKKAFVMDYRVKGFGYSANYSALRDSSKGVAWYIWKLPERLKLTSGFYSEGKAIITAGDNNGRIYYMLTMQGSTDNFFCEQDGNIIQAEERPIRQITTKNFDFGEVETKKNITAVYITANCEDAVEITLTGDDGTSLRRIHLKNMLGTVRISPLMRPTKTVKITIKTNGMLSLYAIKFNYIETDKVR